MTHPRRTAHVTAIAAALTLAAPRTAAAAERCPSLAVEADEGALARAPALLAQVRAAFADREDVDGCAEVRVTLRGSFHVAVTLPDGRVAERAAARIEDVIAVLEALLVVPAAPPPEPAEATLASPPEIGLPPPGLEPSGDRVEPSPERHRREPQPAGHHVRLEASAVTGTRVGAGPVGFGVGVLGFAEISRWLVGVSARIDSYTMPQAATTVLELAPLAGRRLRWEDVTLDFDLGPAVLLRGTGMGDVRPAGTVHPRVLAPPPEPRSPVLPRLVAGARLTFRARSTFRTFVGVDGEIGPGGEPENGNRPLPIATIGLALGATVGTAAR